MNKIFIVISFVFFLGTTNAQDTLAIVQKTAVTTTKSQEKEIIVDADPIALKTFSKNYKQKYSDSDFVYEYQAAEKNAWDRFKEWLVSLLLDFFQLGDAKTSILVIKILAVLIILFVIYLITKAIINKEGRWIFGTNSNKKKIDYYDIEKNIHLVDFEKLIRESLEQGKKRLCVRYYYLWLLKVMAENNFIDWHVDKTNTDYLYELQSKPLKDEFTYLSYLYNYIWYGEFDMDDSSFQNTQSRFKNALKTFGNE